MVMSDFYFVSISQLTDGAVAAKGRAPSFCQKVCVVH